MKVDQLRSELKARGLNTTGTKPVLVARLQAAMDADESPSAAETPAEASAGPANEGTTETAAQTVAVSAQAEPAAAETATAAAVSDEPSANAPKDSEVQAAENPSESKTEGGGSGDGDGSDGANGAASDTARLSMEKRVAARSARFGGTDEGKLAARALRFGLNENGVGLASGKKSGATGAATVGKRNTDGVAIVSAEEQARRAKRAKRFAAES